MQWTRSLVYLCDCGSDYTCSGGRVLWELRWGTGIQTSPGMQVVRVFFENGWLSNGVRGGDGERASGRPLAQERWHIWENWTMMISVTRMQTRLVRHRLQEPNQDQMRQVLWLTWTILSFISGTMVSHWDVLNNWICGAVSMKSGASHECLKRACLWPIRNSTLNLSQRYVCLSAGEP